MQLEVGSSLALLATRSLKTASAHGLNGTVSPRFMPTVISPITRLEGRHSPAIDGRPSAVRGAGAERLALHSGVRGTPAVGMRSHCERKGTVAATMAIA